MIILKCGHILKDNQHGFSREKSCLTQLLPLIDKFSVALNNKSTMSENDIELLIKQRDEARKLKNFAKADEIRDQLDNNHVVLEDVDGKTIWRVKK